MARNSKLYKAAVTTFGHAPQIDMAVKEAASLIGEIQNVKKKRLIRLQELIDERNGIKSGAIS